MATKKTNTTTEATTETTAKKTTKSRSKKTIESLKPLDFTIQDVVDTLELKDFTGTTNRSIVSFELNEDAINAFKEKFPTNGYGEEFTGRFSLSVVNGADLIEGFNSTMKLFGCSDEHCIKNFAPIGYRVVPKKVEEN
jgi:hypothetical protein